MTDAADSLMLDDLTKIAHQLGLAFGREAQSVEDLDRKIELFRLFDRCFFSVRVGISLRLRLGKAPAAQAARDVQRSDRERLDAERPERLERTEPDDTLRYEPERDRDREVERASLPILLRALEGVAADAARLPGPEPADLPKLRELLAQARSGQPPPAPARRPAATPLRARLTGSATPLVFPLPKPRATQGPLTRRATGPPLPFPR